MQSLYHKTLQGLEGKDQYIVIIGAMDGVAHDELAPYVQRNKEWSGLLVEPVPSYFEELRKNYPNRENLIFENVAITKEAGSFDIYTVDRDAIAKGEVPFWCNGISTLHKDGPTIGRDGIKDKVKPEKVAGCRFEELVKKYSFHHIDILQIDAEGYDYTIFQQIWDLGFRPNVLYVEIVHMRDAEVQILTAQLHSHGYELERCGDNLAAVKRLKVSVAKSRKRIAFYTYPQWALGAIHSALCKELYPYHIDADILDWTQKYTQEEWKDFNKSYDLIVTSSGEGVHVLTNAFYVPYDKVILIAHGQKDFEEGVHRNINFNALHRLGVVAQSLAEYAKRIGITRKIDIVRNGIHFDRFYKTPAQRLKNIGYAGALQHLNLKGTDCKRSHLVTKLGEGTHLPVHVAGQRAYLRMPQFYSEVDCVVVSSDAIESCALPLMEAAAAGRLPLSAKIGIASEFEHPPGLILPLEEDGFVREGVERLNALKENEKEFQRLCAEAQEFARQKYDWSCVIKRWVDILA